MLWALTLPRAVLVPGHQQGIRPYTSFTYRIGSLQLTTEFSLNKEAPPPAGAPRGSAAQQGRDCSSVHTLRGATATEAARTAHGRSYFIPASSTPSSHALCPVLNPLLGPVPRRAELPGARHWGAGARGSTRLPCLRRAVGGTPGRGRVSPQRRNGECCWEWHRKLH